MPTYTVTVANLSLSPQQKSQIAEAITAAHSNQTKPALPGSLPRCCFMRPMRATTLWVAE